MNTHVFMSRAENAINSSAAAARIRYRCIKNTKKKNALRIGVPTYLTARLYATAESAYIPETVWFFFFGNKTISIKKKFENRPFRERRTTPSAYIG